MWRESGSALALENERHGREVKGRARETDAVRRPADGREGRLQTRCASDGEGWGEEVNRQCHSRNRTKYIYINSLLYNHDKQTKNNIHTKI